MKYQLQWLAPVLLVTFALGCSGSTPAPTDAEMGISSPQAALAQSVKIDIEDLQACIDDEGAEGLAGGMAGFIENLSGYGSDPAAAQSADTFAKIKQAAEELQTMASGSASKKDLKAKIAEMLTLADSLAK